MSSKEKADKAAEALKVTLKDFPTFILFCVSDGVGGGFALSGSSEKAPTAESNARLAAQMTDTLMNHQPTLDFLRAVIEEVDLRKSKIN
jgi:hypothetical protein